MTEAVADRALPGLRILVGRGEPLLPIEPTTLPDLFRQSVLEHDLPDALNYKRDGKWNPISSARDDLADREYRARPVFAWDSGRVTTPRYSQLTRRTWTFAGCRMPVCRDHRCTDLHDPLSRVRQIHPQRFGAKVLFVEEQKRHTNASLKILDGLRVHREDDLLRC